jgi:hypothetical protein
MSVIRNIAVAAMLLGGAVTGCSGSAGSGATSKPGAPAAARRDRTTITADELSQIEASNLFEVVQHLHPDWLTPHNASAIRGGAATDIMVYIDTQRAGTSEYLKQMAVNSAAGLKFYSASEAQARFGNGNLNGVIQVITVRR